MLTEIKRKLIHQNTQGYYWWLGLGPVSGGIGAVFLYDKIFSGKPVEK
jgi:hypothetical protein